MRSIPLALLRLGGGNTDLGSGQILNSMSSSGFQHVYLGQDDLVIKLLELLK
jgi:hypothetical protein